MNIPDMGTGCKGNKGGLRTTGVTDALRSLNVGESIQLSRQSWATVGSCARNINIKIATRSLGSPDKITVYRIE